MRPGPRWSLVPAAVVVAACATTDRVEPDGPVVVDIDVRGNQAISDRELRGKLVTQETGWWPLAREHRFDRVEWQTDLERIERYYETRGFYRAEVTASQVERRGSDAVALKVQIAEHGRARVDEVVIRGLGELPPERREELTADVPLARGDVFREQDWQQTQTGIRSGLRNQGHAAAALVGEAKVDLASQTVDLDILAAPGPVFRFGEVSVYQQGPGHVEPTLIEEQAELALGPERRFSDAALEEAQRRVFAMGVFATARVRPGALDHEHNEASVLVEVRGMPRHTLRLGGGVGIDQVRQEARLLAGWADRNFFGGLRRLNLEAVAGWAFIPNTLAVVRGRPEDAARHGPIYRGTAEFHQPRLFGRPTLALDALLESERTLEPAYDAIGGRGRLELAWRPTARLRIAPGYNLQGYWMNGPPAATVGTAPLALGCTSDPCFVRLSYLEQTATWDARDHPLEPRQGLFLSLSLQEGGGPLGGDFDYLRVLPEARAYLTPGDGPLTLSGRLRVGTLAPRSGRAEDSPVVTRFYAGGPNSMRGFGLRRLSPLLLVPVDADRPDVQVALPVGGNGLIEGSFEVRSRISEKLLAAGFLDFGTVTQQRLPLAQPGSVMWALGTGLRYLTPIGPLRLDLGVRLPFGRPPPLYDSAGTEITYQRLPGGGTVPGTEQGDHVNRSCLGIGGGGGGWVRDGLCAVHISIGEAF